MNHTPCPYPGVDIFYSGYLVGAARSHQIDIAANETDGRTVQVNFSFSLVALPLPPFPVCQVDLEVYIEVVYGE